MSSHPSLKLDARPLRRLWARLAPSRAPRRAFHCPREERTFRLEAARLRAESILRQI